MVLNCRDCSEEIRERCIQASDTSPSVKRMMRRAFEAGTDTEQMWGLLQMSCPLLPREEQGAKMPRQTSLMRRLKGEPEPAEAAEEIEELAPPLSPARPSQPTPVPVRGPTREPVPAQLGEVGREREETAPPRYCLALQYGQHRIALPAHGEIVLGRFDPTTNVILDVDLSYDDRRNHVISRRHARIVGRNGRHGIEDLGSTNGTRINGQRLRIGQKVQLRSSDRVALGHCEFVYGPIPGIQASPHAALSQVYLWVTFTGHWFPLPSWGEVVVGRRDPAVGFVPEIDLSREGDAAQVIARRHIKIVVRNRRHYVEDLGSVNGTKLNGVPLGIGKLGLLNLGDHIWLGGCVLAYDVKLQPDEQSSD